MNKRIKKKIAKRKLNTPIEYLQTGGFLMPFSCPNCQQHYSMKYALNNSECAECGQKLIKYPLYQKTNNLKEDINEKDILMSNNIKTEINVSKNYINVINKRIFIVNIIYTLIIWIVSAICIFTPFGTEIFHSAKISTEISGILAIVAFICTILSIKTYRKWKR